MSHENGAEQGHDKDAGGQTPLDMVREQHAREQHNLDVARHEASLEAESREVEDQRIEADKEVPGRANPSDIRHHPQRIKY